MKNKVSKILLVVMVAIAFYACKKSFLTVNPQGVLDETTLATEKGVNKLLIAAYAMLDGSDGVLGLANGSNNWGSSGSNYLFGDMGAGIANKGSDPADQCPNMCGVIRHDITSNNLAANDRWRALYEGVKRTNTVLEVLTKVANISDASRTNIIGQARALRAWYHFQLKITFGKIAYMDEQADLALSSGSIKGVSNEGDPYPQILADAKFAYDNLPGLQDAKGRINKWTAGAIYGKILVFAKDWPTAKTVLQNVVTNGTTPTGVKYDLLPNFDDAFNLDFDNSQESVFAFQASSKDNAGAFNGVWGDLLNTPAAAIGGAGFYTPTFWFANQFKTDAAGLPAANPQNKQVYDTAGVDPSNHTGASLGYTLYSGNVDVRLDWTIGRNGVPFHDWGTFLTSWNRDPTAGAYGPKKNMIRQAQVGATHDASVWFSAGGVALNLNLIRFSDVILLLAEAEIEAPGGSLPNAFSLVNRVRTRAQNSRVVVFPATLGVPVTKPYVLPFATQTEARTALRLERLLELGMEGHRFFDLVRWGTAATDLNNFYAYESTFPYQTILKPKPTYTSPGNDYYPVPQAQIDLGNGFIKP